MNDLISRQAAIDVVDKYFKMIELNGDICIDGLISLPSAQPETHDKRTETHACDCVSGVAAIIAAIEAVDEWDGGYNVQRANMIKDAIKALPSAQPEIIHCKDCKYAEVADQEDNQDGYTCQFHRGSIWFSGCYCSWAERKDDDKTNKGSSC